MSHRKAYSQGNVPFSWEDKPGVSKSELNHPNNKNMVVNGLILSPQQPMSSLSPSHPDKPMVTLGYQKIIPPPPFSFQPPRRSFSLKGLWGQDDPFLAALKQCSKAVGSEKMTVEYDKNGVKSKVRKTSRSIFSCKQSCDVEEHNLLKLSSLPSLPRDRYRGPAKVRD